ncbi:hypothetical protein PTKIN_Ptkin16aG0493300 [Pterospermum kingtungense]
MELQHFSHQHPLVFIEERGNENEKVYCSGCGEMVSGPAFSCVDCGFHLHKQCAEAPSEMNHPFHRNHSFNLLKQHPYIGECLCDFCGQSCNNFVYHCSCNLDLHIKCALFSFNFPDKKVAEFQHISRIDSLMPYSVIKETKDGDNVVATEIKHFGHEHNLVLSNDMSDDKNCDGCVLSIFTCYYGCSECGFFLHKSCAELPRKMHLWFDLHPKLHPLTVDRIFRCCICEYESNGFAYTCYACDSDFCLRCALVSDNPICEGHEHRLPYYKYEALCNACGRSLDWPFRCKGCNFALDSKCLTLPLTARHNKSDEHPYKLTYHDNKNYPESNYCDICEEERNPNHWFYHCAICDNSAHPECALGKYAFFKLGSIYTKGDHPHPLTFVHMVHHYPECHRCGYRCLDLALECKTTGCSYIVHWECIKPRGL